MTVETEFGDLMNQTVVVTPGTTGADFYGGPTAGTASTYKAYVESVQHLVKDQLGRDVMAKTRIYVGQTSTGGLPAVKLGDIVSISAGHNPKLLAVDTFWDEFGNLHHQVLHGG